MKQAVKAKTRTLGALRRMWKQLEADIIKTGNRDFIEGDREFYYIEAENIDPIEIDKEDFFATPEENRGHPRPGTYVAQIIRKDTADEVLWSESGVWLGDAVSIDGDEEKGLGGVAGAAKTIVGAAERQVHNLLNDMARLRSQLASAEQRETEARDARNAMSDALLSAKEEVLAARHERDEHEYQRQLAEARADAFQQEIEAMKERGEDLIPAGKQFAKTGFRILAPLLGYDVDPDDDDVEEISRHVCQLLVARQNIQWAIGLATRDADGYGDGIPWPYIRALLLAAYDIQAEDLQDIPPPDWQPPIPQPEIVDAEVISAEGHEVH